MRSKTLAILTIIALCLSLATAIAPPLASPAQASPMQTLHLSLGPPTSLQGSNTRPMNLQPGDEIIQFTRPNLIVGTNPLSWFSTMGRNSHVVTGDLSGTMVGEFDNVFATWDGSSPINGYSACKATFSDGNGNTFSCLTIGDFNPDMTGITGYVLSTSGTGIFSGQVLVGTISGSALTLRRYSGSEISGPTPINGDYTFTMGNMRSLGTGFGTQPFDEFIQFTRANISIPHGDPASYLTAISASGSYTGALTGTVTHIFNSVIIPNTDTGAQGYTISTFNYTDGTGTIHGIQVHDVYGSSLPSHGILFALTETGTTGAYAGKEYYIQNSVTGSGSDCWMDGNLYTLTPGGPQPTPPAVTTNQASNVFGSSAIVHGYLDSMGSASSIDVSFEWATEEDYDAMNGNYTNETSPLWPMTSTVAFSFSLTGLSPDTTYHFRAKAAGDGTAFGSDTSFTTAEAGIDGDGVPSNIEDAAPNSGDGNYDGTLDSLQADVASIPNAANGEYATIDSPGSTSLANVAAVNVNSLPTDGKPNLVFPYGLFAFDITGIDAGITVRVTLTFENPVPAGSQYWKYGPTPDNHTPHWYQIAMNSNDGDNIIEIPLVDGGLGDDDLTANTVIIDQGGPGWPPPPGGGGAAGVPVFPSVYVGIGAALGAGILAFFVRRRVIHQR